MRSYARYAWLFLLFVFSLVIPERIQTCTDSSIKESDQERQRNAEEVEDFRKQLSKAAAEACLHLGFPIVRKTLHDIARLKSWDIDMLRNRYADMP